MTGSGATSGNHVRVFLSGVRSVTHLLYASSYLHHLIADTGASVTLVDLGLGQYLGRANVTAQNLREMCGDDPELTLVGTDGAPPWHGNRDERCVYMGVGAPGIKPYLRLRLANPSRRLHVVVIDEGLGSYGDWRTKRDALRREGGREPWASLRSSAVSAARRTLTDERWALFRQVGTDWLIDDRVAATFRARVTVPASPARVCVFLSQPWVDLRILSEAAYLAHVSRVAEACRSAGLGFVLRPHPAEPAGRYAGFQTTVDRGPAELDPDVWGASVVIGATSTALLNTRALYGTPAIRVVAPECAHLDDQLSPGQKSLLDAFLPAARPVEALPDMLSELG